MGLLVKENASNFSEKVVCISLAITRGCKLMFLLWEAVCSVFTCIGDREHK